VTQSAAAAAARDLWRYISVGPFFTFYLSKNERFESRV